MFWSVAIPSFLFICFVLLLVIAYTPVESGEVYSLKRFGKFRRALRPGGNFIIPFLDKVEKLSTKTREREFPAEPEEVSETKGQLEPGKKKPFFVVYKGAKEAKYYQKKTGSAFKPDPKNPLASYEKVSYMDLPLKVRKAMADDPTHAPLTAKLPAVVEWYLKGDDSSVQDHLENIDNSSRPRDEEVDRRLSDKAEQIMQELLGDTTVGHAFEMFALLNQVFKIKMEAHVGEIEDPDTGWIDKKWGIHIASAYMKSADLGLTINAARADAAAAVSRRRDSILDSEAQAQTIRNTADAKAHEKRVLADATAHEIREVGKADKDREIAEGEGKAGHVEAMAKAIVQPGGLEAARLNVAESALTANGRTIYLPTDAAALAGALTAVQEMAAIPKPPDASSVPSA